MTKRRTWLVMVRALAIASVALIASTQSVGADISPKVVFENSKTAPRSVESLTERSIVRDYKFAWANLALALESNSTDPLNGLFVGNASGVLADQVTNQKRSGLTSRYLNQSHKVDAVFYSVEGDVMELHDTAEYDLQVLDGSKTIYQEHVVARYIVLMTPAADRWAIRQLESVDRF